MTSYIETEALPLVIEIRILNILIFNFRKVFNVNLEKEILITIQLNLYRFSRFKILWNNHTNGHPATSIL